MTIDELDEKKLRDALTVRVRRRVRRDSTVSVDGTLWEIDDAEILVGLPELEGRLAMRRNRSLFSRIHWRLHLDPLVPDDTAEYLRTRLERAGGSREILSSDATAMLHEATVGAMRDLDRLATAALRETARRKKKLVERDVVARIFDRDSRED